MLALTIMSEQIDRKIVLAALLGFICLIKLPSQALASFSIEDNNGNLGDLELYKISWRGPLTTTNNIDSYNSDNVINISTREKHQYKCIAPNSNDQINFDTSARNLSNANEEVKTPVRLLEPLLKSNYCSFKFELFWVYELCHGRFLRQYHQEGTNFKAKITQEYILGHYDWWKETDEDAYNDAVNEHMDLYDKQWNETLNLGKERATILVNGVHKPYVMFNMTGGTKCDLTKENRIAKIVYVCNEEFKHELYSIKEISTCEYEAVILTPYLCHHPEFKTNVNTPHEIQCYALGNAPRKPKNSIEELGEEDIKRVNKRQAIAYFQGKTLVIDADLLLAGTSS